MLGDLFLANRAVNGIVFRGAHLYEGYSARDVTAGLRFRPAVGGEKLS